jgi:Na+-driven multidrug efflux pump
MIPPGYGGFVVAAAAVAATLLFRRPIIALYARELSRNKAEKTYEATAFSEFVVLVIGGFITGLMIASGNTTWAWFPLTAGFGSVACFVASYLIPENFFS